MRSGVHPLLLRLSCVLETLEILVRFSGWVGPFTVEQECVRVKGHTLNQAVQCMFKKTNEQTKKENKNKARLRLK